MCLGCQSRLIASGEGTFLDLASLGKPKYLHPENFSTISPETSSFKILQFFFACSTIALIFRVKKGGLRLLLIRAPNQKPAKSKEMPGKSRRLSYDPAFGVFLVTIFNFYISGGNGRLLTFVDVS